MTRSGVVDELGKNERIRAMFADIVITEQVVITEHRKIITEKVVANVMSDCSTEVIKSISF